MKKIIIVVMSLVLLCGTSLASVINPPGSLSWDAPFGDFAMTFTRGYSVDVSGELEDSVEVFRKSNGAPIILSAERNDSDYISVRNGKFKLSREYGYTVTLFTMSRSCRIDEIHYKCAYINSIMPLCNGTPSDSIQDSIVYSISLMIEDKNDQKEAIEYYSKLFTEACGKPDTSIQNVYWWYGNDGTAGVIEQFSGMTSIGFYNLSIDDTFPLYDGCEKTAK